MALEVVCLQLLQHTQSGSRRDSLRTDINITKIDSPIFVSHALAFDNFPDLVALRLLSTDSTIDPRYHASDRPSCYRDMCIGVARCRRPFFQLRCGLAIKLAPSRGHPHDDASRLIIVAEKAR